eukprot:TRINITY_DN15306_c0_g1_i1.p1 TRINITY_DN15306_c0_g1~~TRINITY_DN15306_c0_g1_i1.p1  ORF type:complete len:421 (+),score=80.56 TRINITY_DN15306_c0_g1_i1:272-1534(+)
MMMKKLFQSAFKHPDHLQPTKKGEYNTALRSRSGYLPDGSSKSERIVPRQSEDELVLSEVHAKLDRVIYFLQKEVGFTLLNDAKPSSGGGVTLSNSPPRPGEALPRGVLSSRSPHEEPVSDEAAAEDHSPLDKENSRGRQETGRGTASEFKEAASRRAERKQINGTPAEVIRFSPETAKHAHYREDLVLLDRFTSIMAEACPAAATLLNSHHVYRTVLQGMHLMHACNYHYSDVVVTLAHASVYFAEVFDAVRHRMTETEVAHVCVLLIYLAHITVLDEACPLKHWHQFIFKKYCTMKVLNAALFRLFSLKNFRLRISQEEQHRALAVLLCTAAEPNVILTLDGRSCGRSKVETHAGPAVVPISKACLQLSAEKRWNEDWQQRKLSEQHTESTAGDTETSTDQEEEEDSSERRDVDMDLM